MNFSLNVTWYRNGGGPSGVTLSISTSKIMCMTTLSIACRQSIQLRLTYQT